MPASSSPPFIISRTFDAPRALVWQVWTQTEHLMRWFSPKGLTNVHAALDLRPGGTLHYCLRTPDGGEMWGKWVFREVSPPERLVWVHSFSDAQGGTTRHPMAADWPLEMLSTATFTETGGRTTVRLEWIALNATPAEQKVFDDQHGGMRGGWTGTFDQLQSYLAQLP
jgi:uncharacterized protein YndB with AHSA1/START domain